MSESIEKLQQIDGHVTSTIDLLTRADQALEQALQLYHDYSRAIPNPVDLASAIKAIQTHLHGCVDQHNQLVAQIRQAQEEAASHAEVDPNLGY